MSLRLGFGFGLGLGLGLGFGLGLGLGWVRMSKKNRFFKFTSYLTKQYKQSLTNQALDHKRTDSNTV